MKIGGRINLLVGMMSAVALIVGGLSLFVILEFRRSADLVSIAADRAQHGEVLNHLVTAVDMESRSLYTAADTKAAAPFAKALASNIDKMQAVITEWTELVPERQKEAFASIQQRYETFKNFRLGTAKLATDISPRVAAAQGDNEENRKSREIFQSEIDAVVSSDIEELAELRSAMQSMGDRMFWAIVLVTSVGIVAGVAFGLFVGIKQLSQPIRRVAGVMKDVADGNLDAAVPFIGRSDEIGEMAAAVEIFKQNGLEVRQMNEQEAAMRAKSDDLQAGMAEVVDAAAAGDFTRRIEKDYGDENLNRFAANINSLLASVEEGVVETGRVVQALAQGDLTERMNGEFRGIFGELQSNVNEAVDRLTELMAQVRSTTGTISQSSSELTSSAGDLSKRTEQQAAALEETSAALDEITSVVNTSTERANEATKMVADAKDKTEASAKVVGEAVSAMGRIENASGEISQIINVIDEIAFQTNLLALNAGVEAARAGEAGKGFAVVAQEVRELAQRSATAAKDIKQLITRSGDEVQRGVSLVQKTGAALQEIQERVVQINAHINSIAQAAHEQSTGLTEVNNAINQMDQVTQKNAAMVEESSAATVKLSNEAETLVQLVMRFKIAESARSVEMRSRPQPVEQSDAPQSIVSPVNRMLEDLSRTMARKSVGGGGWESF